MGREQMRCNTIRYDGVVEVRWRFRICGTGKQGVSAGCATGLVRRDSTIKAPHGSCSPLW